MLLFTIRTAWVAAAVLLAAPVTSAQAGEADGKAAPSVQAAPMTKLLYRVHETFPGRILKVDLDDGQGPDTKPVYKVKVLTSSGNVLKLFYDAQTLSLEKVLGRYGQGAATSTIRDGSHSTAGGDGGRGGNDAGSDGSDSGDASDGSSSDN